MYYAYDLLADPKTFNKYARARVAGTIRLADERTIVRLASLQLKVATLEYRKTGSLGKIQNWVSNAISSGLAMIKGLREKFMGAFTTLTQKFISSGGVLDAMTEGLQISIAQAISASFYESWWVGYTERKWKFDTNKDRDYRTGELVDGWFETDEDRGTKEVTSPVSGQKIAFDYESYLQGWLYYDNMVKDSNPVVQSVVEESRGEPINYNSMPQDALAEVRSLVTETVQRDMGKKVIAKILSEVNGLINPLSLWPAMKDTYKTIVKGDDSQYGVLLAGAGALLMGAGYFVFKYLLAKMLGLAGTAGILGSGIILHFLTDSAGITLVKSILAKKVAKKFAKLWKDWFGGSHAVDELDEEIRAQTSQRDYFVRDVSGQIHDMKEVQRHPEIIRSLELAH